MARKVILTSSIILIGGESRANIALACILSGFSSMLLANKKPIEDASENSLMVVAFAVTFVNLIISAVSRIPAEVVPQSADAYLDHVTFNTSVFGANVLVIGILLGKHVIY